MKVELSKDGKQITITLDVMDPPQPSSTGKSLIIASTSGFTPANATLNGRPIRINVTAIVKP